MLSTQEDGIERAPELHIDFTYPISESIFVSNLLNLNNEALFLDFIATPITECTHSFQSRPS